MKNLLTILSLLWAVSIFSQPIPCVTDQMTPLCEDACVVCDINGFTGRNDSQVRSPKPDGFCTSTAHNITWIAFIAGTTNLTLDVFVSNCERGRGLEVGIYESLDCETMRLVSNCDGDMDEDRTTRFITTEPLVVGQYYYFVMDGNRGDICDYTVTVIDGSTLVGDLEPITFIDGEETTCLGDTLVFNVPERPGANFQEWSIDGAVVLEQSTTLEYSFPSQGVYEVCYSAFNVCDEIPEICKTVTVRPLPTILRRDTVCESDCYYLPELDTLICTPGQNTIEEKLPNGCTQKYLIDLIVRNTPSSDLVLEFCSGDSVLIGNEYFSQSGNYTPTLTSREGCDSLVRLAISTFLCDIDGGFADDNLDCPGDSDGTLTFNLLDGAFPYQYAWEEETGTGLTGSGTSTTPGVAVEIPGLPAGIYSVTVTDADGSRGVFVGQIFEPSPIYTKIELSDYNGFNTTCPDAEDGSASVYVDGGTPGYTYRWDGSPSLTGAATDLPAGAYSVSITDAAGCEVVLNPEIIAPQPITANLQITEPECNPDNSGVISALDIKGGIGPFQAAFESDDFGNTFSFGNLFAGNYQMTIRDLNGCEIAFDTTLSEPNTLNMELGNDLEIFLGDSIELIPQINLDNLTYDWSGGAAISCPDCPMTFVRPFEDSEYNLLVTMPNRCTKSDSIFIKVIDRRRVFVPSAFSPNNDGINDFLSIFSGPEVSQVTDFQVFDRWGGLIYKTENFQPNNPEFGWNGKFRGDDLDSGVYAWMANIEFIDGQTRLYEGDVSLLR